MKMSLASIMIFTTFMTARILPIELSKENWKWQNIFAWLEYYSSNAIEIGNLIPVMHFLSLVRFPYDSDKTICATFVNLF